MTGRTIGFLLCGGRSERFGSPKALAQLQGRPLVAWGLDALQATPTVEHVLVLTSRALLADIGEVIGHTPNVTLLPDASEHRGPAFALSRAVAHVEEDPSGFGHPDKGLLVPTDHPLVAPAVLDLLLQRATDAPAMPAREGTSLHGILAFPWKVMLQRGLLDLSHDAPLRDLLRPGDDHQIDAEELRTVDPDLRSLIQVTGPGDLEAAAALLGQG